MSISPSRVEQETRQELAETSARPSLAWLVLNTLGGVLAFTVLAGTLAGRGGVPISPTVLLGGAALGGLPGLWAVARGRWAARWPDVVLAVLAFALVAGTGLWLAWPALLPLGRSVDAVHQYQLVHWIAVEQRLPPVDAETNGLLGEMIAYPTGLAFVVNAAAAIARVSPLDALYPTVALLGGLCAALVALLAASAAGGRGWRMLLPGIAAVLLLLAHRAYFLEAYTDSSYYAQVLGLTLALLACGWIVCQPKPGTLGALQLGALLAALLATYPLWVPVPLALAVLLLLARRPTTDERRATIVQLAMLLAPLAIVAAIDLPARLGTGQVVLENQGVVTPPTLFGLMPLVLAVPAVLVLVVTRKRGAKEKGKQKNGKTRNVPLLPLVPPLPDPAPPLLFALLFALLAVGALALAAQFGLIAPYHSVKMLFLVVPLAAAVVGAALIRLTVVRPLPLRVAVVALAAGMLWFTSGRFLVPVRAEQIPNRDLVAAAAWLRENDSEAANRATLVGAPPGPLAYWLQVALLHQRRDQAEAAVRAFTETPPTPLGWAVDATLPDVVVAPNLAEAPPGSEIAARFGRAAVLRRTALDMQAANPLVLRYASRWEENRLKTALELLRPLAGPLPLVELRLVREGQIVTTFALQPDAERTKPQYLGADVIPATLGGVGYINADAYPTFAPPADAPAGAFELMLRLSANGQTLDERLLATFDRASDGMLLNLSLHSGELDYARREYGNANFNNRNTRFGEQLVLAGWKAEPQADGGISALLRWKVQTAILTPLSTELRLTDGEGNVVARSRSAPQDGFYPTWRWRPGEDVTERRTLPLPPLPAGIYTLHAAAFDEITQTELPANGPTRLGEVILKR